MGCFGDSSKCKDITCFLRSHLGIHINEITLARGAAIEDILRKVYLCDCGNIVKNTIKPKKERDRQDELVTNPEKVTGGSQGVFRLPTKYHPRREVPNNDLFACIRL